MQELHTYFATRVNAQELTSLVTTPTATPTDTVTPTVTPTPTPSDTPIVTPTPTDTLTVTPTISPSPRPSVRGAGEDDELESEDSEDGLHATGQGKLHGEGLGGSLNLNLHTGAHVDLDD